MPVGRPCSVCSHPERRSIDVALVSREAFRAISCRYHVGRESLRRHAQVHIPQQLAKAHEAEEVARADDLLGQLRGLRAKVVSLLYKAEQAGELRTAVAAAKEARQNLETLAKVRGELDERPVVNVLISSEWLQLRTLIIRAVQPHPEALADVLKALEEASNGRP